MDWTGFLSLSIAIAAFQYLLDRGERNDWFESEFILLLAVVGILAFYVFVVHSMTHDQPFLNLVLIRDRNYVLGLVLIFIFGMILFTPMVLLPPMLQTLRGYPDAVIGILGARGLGGFLAFVLMTQANKIDPRYALFIGFALQEVAGWWRSSASI